MRIAFTDRELDIMSALWDNGPSTVTEVREHLTDNLAYTTVQTILRILKDKGYVAHTEDGRAHRFHALVGREAASSSALRRVVDSLFGGSSELVLTHLIRDRNLTPKEVAAMRKLLDERTKPPAKAKPRRST